MKVKGVWFSFRQRILQSAERAFWRHISSIR